MSKALEMARKAVKTRRDNGETIERKNPIEKWENNPSSLRNSVNAMCWQCQGEGEPGTTNGVRNCPAEPHSVKPCPLWHVRPYQEK